MQDDKIRQENIHTYAYARKRLNLRIQLGRKIFICAGDTKSLKLQPNTALIFRHCKTNHGESEKQHDNLGKALKLTKMIVKQKKLLSETRYKLLNY